MLIRNVMKDTTDKFENDSIVTDFLIDVTLIIYPPFLMNRFRKGACSYLQ